ncbi:HhH-GPD family base excision repair protein, partial [mine drainage metagenome]
EVADDAGAMRMLGTLRGIKRWSAQYVALRGLGRLGVFPVDDVGAHKHLAAWLGLPRLDAEATAALVRRWQPYAGLVYFHVLLRRLEEAGHLRIDTPAGSE